MTVNTEETAKNNEQDQAKELKQEKREEEKETENPRISDSSLSLSPLSNRSYKTPSPSADHSAYFDQTHEANEYSWIEKMPTKPPSPLAQRNRSFPAEPLVVTEVLDPEAHDGVVFSPGEEDSERDVGNGNGGGLGSFNRRKLRPDLPVKQRTRMQHGLVKRVLLGFRICGFVFCLISFSVMAANRNQGWAFDSFYRYKEFGYCLGANILGFAYSGLQVFDLIYFISSEKHLVQHRFRCYFDFFMDQMLAYLLMSASSSASTRVDDWQSNWGKDKFPDMARASVGASFAAFVTLAWSSVISGYILCTAKSL
ncbi:CASP-like protein 4A1 [Humulus lupulus]|uniref:CASP-like protein 4A1 n=1 Tax=Humulus lupulus TaxID=3486 RepID=UPI002B4105D0|nr:CASP-like protein 4A1 [Humulus lupulus]